MTLGARGQTTAEPADWTASGVGSEGAARTLDLVSRPDRIMPLHV